MNGFDSVTLLPIGSNQTRVGGGGGGGQDYGCWKKCRLLFNMKYNVVINTFFATIDNVLLSKVCSYLFIGNY